jgi:hypothetical protein
MSKFRWGKIGIFSVILFVGARAPAQYFALKFLFDYTLGRPATVGGNLATHIRGASLLVFGLLVLLLTLAQFSKLKELMVAILIASLALFPMTFGFLIFGLFAACSATFLIYGVSRIGLGYHYYLGRNTDPEQIADGTTPEATQQPR